VLGPDGPQDGAPQGGGGVSELIVFFKPISLSEKLNIFKKNHPKVCISSAG